MPLFQEILETAFGSLLIQANEQYLTKLAMVEGDWASIPNEWTQLAKIQLAEYLAGERQYFSLPYELAGTVFQHDVWRALADIPYGVTCSYQDIALRLGRPRACRAVGSACRNNPLLILLPCHRVLPSSKNGGGYIAGMPMKTALLELEGRFKLAPADC